MIKVGDQLPEATLSLKQGSDMSNPTTAELFNDKKVVLVAVPGAFTPTCSMAHLPGFVVQADEFKAKGYEIYCISVNDAFVMSAWGEQQNAENIKMLADGDGSFTAAMGLEMQTGPFGGLRSNRYAMVVDNGVVTHLEVEQPGQFEVSKAEHVLTLI